MNPEIHTIADLSTAIFDSAPRQGTEAALFVHGNPGPMDDWAQLIEVTRPFIRTVAMDLPGFGRSARPIDFDYRIPGYVDHLDAIITSLGLEKIHLILHDFGGAFGLHWAQANAKKVASITLINTGVLPGYSWHAFARIWQTPVLGELFSFISTPAMVQRGLNQSNPRPLPPAFVEHATRYADWKNKSAVMKLYRSVRKPEAWFGEKAIAALWPHDFNTCVIWGEEDKYLPVSLARQQKRAFPTASIHLIPNAGHWPFIDEPQVVGGILKDFLLGTITTSAGENAHERSN